MIKYLPPRPREGASGGDSFEGVDASGGVEVVDAGAVLSITEQSNAKSGSYTLASNQITVANSGRYIVSPRIGVGTTDGAFGVEAYIRVNGVEVENTKIYLGSGSGSTFTVVAATTTYTIVDGDDRIDCEGTFTVSLPAAAGRLGNEHNIKSGVGTITVDVTGGGTIDGSTSKILTSYESLTVYSNGTEWRVK